MALSDDHPIKITAPEYKSVGQGDLEIWLGKEAEAKKLAAAPKLEDNEDTSTVNYGDLYDKPAGRKDGSNLDSDWGEKAHEVKGEQVPSHNNDATFRAANEERKQVTSRALDSFPAAAAVEKATLAANLDHAKSGDFTTHSVLLGESSKQASLSGRVASVLSKI